MKTSLHTYVGMFSRGLDTLAHLLSKGDAFAKEQGVAEAEMLDWRLAPDMFNLRQQAQTVIRFSEQWPARAAGLEVPADRNDEPDLAGLRAQIEEAKARLAALKPEQFEGRDEATATINLGGIEPTFPMAQWVPGFAVPNFYFHLSMAYAILRNRGVPLGKRDLFAGGL